MELQEYFENVKGIGVLATAASSGKVDAAVYARPHFIEGEKMAFIMRDRLTHHNLQSNPHATYLFVEDAPGFRGKRLYMTKVGEEENSELLKKLSRRQYPDDEKESRFLVFFRLDDALPLVGASD